MDPVVVVGSAIAVAATAVLAPRAVRTVRDRRLPVPELVTTALLFLSVDWAAGRWPTWQVAAVFFSWALLLVLYPDGRAVPPWAAGGLAIYGLVVVVGAFTGYGSALWGALLMAGLVVAGAAQVWRYRRRSSSAEREAAQWLLLGFVVTVTVLSAADLLGVTARPDVTSWWWALLRLVGLVLPVSAALGLVSSGWSSASPVLHHTSAACLTALALAVLYRLGSPHLGPAAVAALLSASSPVLFFLWSRLAERVVYGSGSGAAMRRLGQRLQATLGPDDVVVTVREAVRDSLAVPRAEVEFAAAGRGPAEDGAQEPVERFPVTYQGRLVATLVVTPRPAEPCLTGRDRAVLATMARQAGPALDGARLVHELRAARERLVTTREAERRRIRRDLHDDLGPSLAGLALTASALQQLLAREAEVVDLTASRRLAQDLTGGITDAAGLVRRVVYDLQPLGLEGQRLLPALADRLVHAPATDGHGSGMQIDVDVRLGSRDLPAAVEVAAARIVTEAVTNARRHAAAGRCSVTLVGTVDTLTITVADDGHGMRPDTVLGVGLRSIEERADELGGTSEVLSGPRGTTVRVALPLASATSGARS